MFKSLCRNVILAAAFVVTAASTLAVGTSRPGAIKVVSYNILHGTNQQNENSLTSQALALIELKPDLVGLQEVDDKCARSAGVDQMKELARLTGMHSAFGPHFDFQGGQYGLGLLSRYPLSDVRTDRITLITKEGTTETRALLSATATLDGGTTVRLATVHMGLNQPSRIIQAREILKHLKPAEQTVVLTGDFNAEPGTEEITILEEALQNTGTSDNGTYPVGKPIKVIDYIMVSRAVLAERSNYHVHTEVPHSDHYPISVELSLKARAQ